MATVVLILRGLSRPTLGSQCEKGRRELPSRLSDPALPLAEARGAKLEPDWLRFQTVSSCPASIRCFAIGLPMMPSPIKPIRIAFLP